MDHLPVNDIPMLVSAINFLLRDEEFDNLDQICYHFNVDRKALERKMSTQGFVYSEKNRRFW
jgi:Zn-dependent peptidase ImmA (M78 family)